MRQCRKISLKPKKVKAIKAREVFVTFYADSPVLVYPLEARTKSAVLFREVLPTKPKEGVRVTREQLAKAWDENAELEYYAPSRQSVSFERICNALGLTAPTYCEHSGAKLGDGK